MDFFSQTNFPRLWLGFQRIVGGNKDKQKLALKHYEGQRRVLEIGCSVGNVSAVFSRFPDIEFTGIDIDESALALARERLGHLKNFKFINISLSDLAKIDEKYDYIIFANILHHVDDATALDLLKDVQKVSAEGSTLIIMEPEKSRQDYGPLFKFFYLLEKGLYRRDREDLIRLVEAAGIKKFRDEDVLVAPDSMPSVKVGRLTLIRAST